MKGETNYERDRYQASRVRPILNLARNAILESHDPVAGETGPAYYHLCEVVCDKHCPRGHKDALAGFLPRYWILLVLIVIILIICCDYRL